MHRKANTSCSFGYERSLLQSVVNSVDRVVLHVEKEARGHLGLGNARVEEGGGGMSEHEFRHEVISFKGIFKIVLVDADRDPHQHVLRPLHNLSLYLQEVGPLERLEPEEVVVKITLVVDDLLDLLVVVHKDIEDFL